MATCGDLHGTPNPCAWIQSHCLEEDPWMAAYLSFIYCRLGRLDPVALAVLLAWLAMVFCVFGRIASRFLCPNLSSISTFLRMPQSMAGVTLAALGNGAPDIFSTFASAQANAFPMALGELLGAANFITMVVVGTIALVSPFQVPRWPFLRDNIAFMVATAMVLCTIIDGNIYFTTSIFLIVYYVLYVIVVVTGSYIRILKTKPSRTFSSATTQGGELDDELSLEEATEHPTIFTTLSPHVITEEIDDDYFGLPMDLPSTVSSHPQRPGSPILGEYSLPRRISAVSSADSTAPQFSPVLSAHLKGAVQSLRNYVYGEGSIRLPENDEESSIQNTDDFVLLPLTDTANGDVPSSSHNSWLMEIYQILFPCLYFWNTLGLWERVYAVLTLPSDFIFSLVTPVISRIVLENLRKEEHNHGYVNLDGDSSPLLGREDTEIMDDADGEHPARLSIVMVRIQLAIGPFFANWIVADGSIDSWMGALVASIVLSILGNVCMLYISLHRTAFLLAIFGFVMSVLEIYYISNILVALIKVIGIVFCINQTLLGLTVLAVGNSLLDLIANANIARLGMPVMAMGASYGSPMLNIMLGLCASVAFAILSTPSSIPILDRYLLLGPLPSSLILSFVALLATLLFSSGYMFLNHFKADRRFGWLLVSGYCVLMAAQLWMEVASPTSQSGIK